jgi:hypothetical protein
MGRYHADDTVHFTLFRFDSEHASRHNARVDAAETADSQETIRSHFAHNQAEFIHMGAEENLVLTSPNLDNEIAQIICVSRDFRGQTGFNQMSDFRFVSRYSVLKNELSQEFYHVSPHCIVFVQHRIFC